MAAFTTFSREALSRYLLMFDLGELQHHAAIEDGIENSNYRLVLNRDGEERHYILTIIENLSLAEVPFFSKVMTHLSRHRLPVAAPLTTLNGVTETTFCDKPAFLFHKLEGSHPEKASSSQCKTIGTFMAKSHQALFGLQACRDNPWNLNWMRDALDKVAGFTTREEQNLLARLVRDYESFGSADLPRGLIHGDLFKDNALFLDQDRLSGVIDFYHACDDLLVQDIAIAINDWCLENGGINRQLKESLLAGYEEIRPLTDEEASWLTCMQGVSAGRFALTRFLSGDPPLKDPGEMLQLAKSLAY